MEALSNNLVMLLATELGNITTIDYFLFQKWEGDRNPLSTELFFSPYFSIRQIFLCDNAFIKSTLSCTIKLYTSFVFSGQPGLVENVRLSTYHILMEII